MATNSRKLALKGALVLVLGGVVMLTPSRAQADPPQCDGLIRCVGSCSPSTEYCSGCGNGNIQATCYNPDTSCLSGLAEACDYPD